MSTLDICFFRVVGVIEVTSIKRLSVSLITPHVFPFASQRMSRCKFEVLHPLHSSSPQAHGPSEHKHVSRPRKIFGEKDNRHWKLWSLRGQRSYFCSSEILRGQTLTRGKYPLFCTLCTSTSHPFSFFTHLERLWVNWFHTVSLSCVRKQCIVPPNTLK